MKTLKIEIPNGFEIDKENSTFEQIVFKEIEKELPLPERWEELILFDGYYVNDFSGIQAIKENSSKEENKNVFATEEQAKASIAFAQLSQLREVYRNGWVPNFRNASEIKYCIFLEGNNVTTNWFYKSNLFLSFQDEKTRDLFLENFRYLIEQAKPLMS